MPLRQDIDTSWPPKDPASGSGRGGARRYGEGGPRDRDAEAPEGSGLRLLPLIGGFVLAVGATLAVFLTDNPQFLRIAVVAVAWAFVLATFAVNRRRGEREAAAQRELLLRQAYEHELEREVAARHEYELGLETELRRETEQSMRGELDALRGEVGQISLLREEVARVSAMRRELADLAALQDGVARVAALRDDVEALLALRQELGQLGELRADLGRLRTELTEKLSSEMLVERITMRTQSSRVPAEPAPVEGPATRALDSRALDSRPLDSRALDRNGWRDDVPPRELTGGWPAVRLDEPRSMPLPPVPAPIPPAVPSSSFGDRWSVRPADELFPRTEAHPLAQPTGQPTAHPAHEAPPVAYSPPTTAQPISAPEWLAPSDGPSASHGTEPEIAPRRRRSDTHRPVGDGILDGGLEDARTTERPAPPAEPAIPADTNPQLAEILARASATPPSGGRRRRRYRDDDEPDDVLARVLGRR